MPPIPPVSYIEAIILGIVEGITEFIPISSTAHLMMTSEILKIENSDFLKSFEIVIQFGAIAAVIFLFGPLFATHSNLWKKILIAFTPTAIIGFALYGLIKNFLIGNLIVAVWSLIIGGIVLILIEIFITKKHQNLVLQTSRSPQKPKETEDDLKNLNSITNTQAFFIGVSQSLAVIPGVSRSAATIIPALLFGSNRKTAAEFSFLLAVPTIGAAAGYDLVKNVDILGQNYTILLVGFIVSFIVSMLTIKLFLSFLQKFSFISFGIYRIVVAIFFLILFI
jgi:undecaprenyl-diphosphatase